MKGREDDVDICRQLVWRFLVRVGTVLLLVGSWLGGGFE